MERTKEKRKDDDDDDKTAVIIATTTIAAMHFPLHLVLVTYLVSQKSV